MLRKIMVTSLVVAGMATAVASPAYARGWTFTGPHGATTGLLAGSLLGAGSGRRATASAQNHYNVAYTQCMAGNGENVAQPATPAPVAYTPTPSLVYLPAQTYAVAPPPVPVPWRRGS